MGKDEEGKEWMDGYLLFLKASVKPRHGDSKLPTTQAQRERLLHLQLQEIKLRCIGKKEKMSAQRCKVFLVHSGSFRRSADAVSEESATHSE